MTYETTSREASPTTGEPTSTKDQATAKAHAAQEVAGRTADRAGEVAGQVCEQAKVVARDAKDHARLLVDQGRSHLQEEANARSRQAASGLRVIADQLGALGRGDQQGAGAIGDYVQQGRQQLSRLADRLEDGPSAVFDDVRRFARRQPVLFLAGAGVCGFVAGRLVRGARDAQADDGAPTAPSFGPATVATPPLDITAETLPATAADSPLPVEDLTP